MELKDEDYENIWLRLKEKFAKWIFAWSVFITAITGYTIYQNIDNLLKANVKKYLESDAGKKVISQQLVEDLPKINEQVNDLDKKVKSLSETVSSANGKIKNMEKVPFKIEPGSVTFISKDGQVVRIDYGQQSPKTTVKFKTPFRNTPYVVATEFSQIDSKPELAIREVTKDGFSLSHANDMLTYKYNWVAIGQ